MGLTREQFDIIYNKYNNRRLDNSIKQDKRLKEIYEKIPQIKECDLKISSLAVNAARSALNGDTSLKDHLKEDIANVSNQKKALLMANGYQSDYLEPIYDCPICKDTGFVNGQPCECLQKEVIKSLYTTEELNQLADTILGSEDRLYALEYETYVMIRETLAGEMERISRTANVIAQIDALASLAYVAERNHFVRPKLNVRGTIDIKDGRHPVVEQVIPNDMFISNDTYLDNKKNRVAIITGPNMAGKSTYMRQVALIVLMAQIGSFVPAAKANIGIVDRIFTRVGASDDLASGQSTFMVEMSEVANILRNATKNSLLILDEIGRGTSTFDGLSIAWAVVEYISNSKLLGAKTLFATHYHELTELEGKIDSVHNYCIAVKEQGDDIVFLRKIVKGGADKSYGVQVAKLAGVPDAVINRAKEIARELEEHDLTSGAKDIMPYGEAQQLSFFRESDEPTMEHPFMAELREKDLSDMTPLEALNYLYVLQEKLKNEE